MVFIFLWLTHLLSIIYSVYPCFCKWQNFVLFVAGYYSIVLSIPHPLYPFIDWWTFGLLLYLGYCKYCGCEHWHSYILSFIYPFTNKLVFYFLQIRTRVELLERVVVLFVLFWGTSILFSIVCLSVLFAHFCPTLCNPMDCSHQTQLSLHGIFQARILEWVSISSFRGSSQPRDWTCIFYITGRLFTTEPPGSPILHSGCTNFCSNQQYIKFLFSLHPCQHLLLTFWW